MTKTLQDKIDLLNAVYGINNQEYDKAIQELREQIIIMHDNATPYHRKRPLENTPEYYLMQVLSLIGKPKK